MQKKEKTNKEKVNKTWQANYSKWRFDKWHIVEYIIIMALLAVTAIWSAGYNWAVNRVLGVDAWREKVYANDLAIHFIDVGQGEAIAIRLPDGKSVLIDAGQENKSRQLKNYLVNVFFAEESEYVFDYVILTHGDSDHCGGMAVVYDLCKVGVSFRPMEYSTTATHESEVNLYNSLTTDNRLYADYIDAIYSEPKSSVVYENNSISYKNFPSGYITGAGEGGQYSLTFLANTKSSYDSSNSASCVVLLRYAGESVLFTGDATDSTFDEIDEACGALGVHDITLYNASHHGSSVDGSNRESTIVALNPQYVEISVGKNNDYGHPHQPFLNTLKTLGIDSNNILRTDENRSCIFSVHIADGGNNIVVCKNVRSLQVIPHAWAITYILIGVVVFIIVFRKNKAKASEREQ